MRTFLPFEGDELIEAQEAAERDVDVVIEDIEEDTTTVDEADSATTPKKKEKKGIVGQVVDAITGNTN